jgi:NAD(P)-dependent dehydrogenase (short-subunit alcohol dehydrogenase family)
MKKSLRGKNCIITGAYGGLGKAVAYRFAAKGCNLFLTGRNKDHIIEVCDEIRNEFKNINVFGEQCNLTEQKAILNLVDNVHYGFGHIDILINSAGMFPINKIAETSINEFDECFNVNIRAPFLLSKLFYNDMMKNKWGRIVNIGSSSSYSGFKNTATYCSSKHALLGLSRSMYLEWKEHGIRVFIVSPGSIKTDMGKMVIGQNYDTFIDPAELADFIVKVISYDDNMISEEIRVNRIIVQ